MANLCMNQSDMVSRTRNYVSEEEADKKTSFLFVAPDRLIHRNGMMSNTNLSVDYLVVYKVFEIISN